MKSSTLVWFSGSRQCDCVREGERTVWIKEYKQHIQRDRQNVSILDVQDCSVARLGDLLLFGQLFKVCEYILLGQIVG